MSAFPLLQSPTNARSKTNYHIAHPWPSPPRCAKRFFQLQGALQYLEHHQLTRSFRLQPWAQWCSAHSQKHDTVSWQTSRMIWCCWQREVRSRWRYVRTASVGDTVLWLFLCKSHSNGDFLAQVKCLQNTTTEVPLQWNSTLRRSGNRVSPLQMSGSHLPKKTKESWCVDHSGSWHLNIIRKRYMIIGRVGESWPTELLSAYFTGNDYTTSAMI